MQHTEPLRKTYMEHTTIIMTHRYAMKTPSKGEEGIAECSNVGARTRIANTDAFRFSQTGWLWGVPPDQKYENEGWEGIWFYGFCGSMILGTIAYAWKPDTRYVVFCIQEVPCWCSGLWQQ